MVNDISEVLTKKIVALKKEKNELVDKYNSILEKHNEMVAHLQKAQMMATQNGKYSGPDVPKLIETFARNDSGNEDFTLEQFNEWKNDISTMGTRIDTLTFTLSTLREIRDSSKTETEKK
tara:strand:+ start:385 stop:744 length:360 start_codon:yes stop_codon:yes gene_type:complete